MFTHISIYEEKPYSVRILFKRLRVLDGVEQIRRHVINGLKEELYVEYEIHNKDFEVI